jgi:hypothetical protein
MNYKVKAVLEGILERFKSGDIPKAIAYMTFPIVVIPSSKWSFMNRLIMYIGNTTDARGIRQWNQVGRKVKKGAKAIYILIPRLIKTTSLNNSEAERVILRGFLTKPVFRVEDTEGEPLDYGEEITLPDLPLMEKAKDWGISVSATPWYKEAYGAYLATSKQIVLATPEEIVFFHELSHAAYERAVEKLRPGQCWDQEIVAELCAQVLCHLVGKNPQDHLGTSYQYIDSYARAEGLSPLSACLKVLDNVHKVLTVLLDLGNGNNEGFRSDSPSEQQEREVA